MTTLIIVAHPKLESSTINKSWLDELEKFPKKYTIHNLYTSYPDGQIDVQKEQELLLAHDKIVLQFPVFWFSSPPFLKTWLDEVFISGFSHGRGGYQLVGKKFALAVSAGIRHHDYSVYGRYKYTMEQVLTPFVATFIYCKIDYRSYFAFYGRETPADDEPTEDDTITEDDIQQSTVAYLKFIDEI